MFPIANKQERIAATITFLLEKINLLDKYNQCDIDHSFFGSRTYLSMRASKNNSRLELYNQEVGGGNTMCAGLVAYNTDLYTGNHHVEFSRKVDEYYQIVVQPNSGLLNVKELHTNNEYTAFGEDMWFQLSTTSDVLPYDSTKLIVDAVTDNGKWDAYSFWYNDKDDYMFHDSFDEFFDKELRSWERQMPNL